MTATQQGLRSVQSEWKEGGVPGRSLKNKEERVLKILLTFKELGETVDTADNMRKKIQAIRKFRKKTHID